MWNLNDNFKRYQMDHAMLNGDLIQQHEKVQQLGHDVYLEGHKGDAEGDLWMRKVLRVIQGVLHQLHRPADFWMKHHVDHRCGYELGKQEREIGCSIQVVVAMLIHNGGGHTNDETQLNGGNIKIVDEIFRLFFFVHVIVSD